MARVAGKVALITGAGSLQGLGYAIAVRLSEEGAAVVLTDVDEAAVQDAARQIAEQGGRAFAMGQDVTDEARWQQVAAATVERFGGLDILVNNAGIVQSAPLDEMTADSFRRQVDINLTGTFLGAQAVVRVFLTQGRGGAIVNLSSVAGLVGHPRLAAYNASKGGVRLLSKSIALEYADRGIRCNSVHPGKILTGMLQRSPSATSAPDQLAQDVPMKRVGEPRDIANCVLFLASDEATYITGAEFAVDGGLTAQ